MRGDTFALTPTSRYCTPGNIELGDGLPGPNRLPEFRITVTSAEPLSAAAASGLPSPLKSSDVMERGPFPTGSSDRAVKDLLPALSSTVTALSVISETARSESPSRLKSATAIYVGPLPAEKSLVAPATNVPRGIPELLS